MNNLELFLTESVKENKNKKVDIGGRLAGQELEVRPLTSEEYNIITQTSTDRTKKGVVVNQVKMMSKTVAAGLVNPNMKSQELLQAAGVSNAEAAVNKLFLPGEIAKIAEEVLAASGFGNYNINDDIEVAENF